MKVRIIRSVKISDCSRFRLMLIAEISASDRSVNIVSGLLEIYDSCLSATPDMFVFYFWTPNNSFM